jgi:hypothetical protein
VAEATAAPGALPELGGRPLAPACRRARLRRLGLGWTATTVAHVVPFAGGRRRAAGRRAARVPRDAGELRPRLVIPELYAARGANVVRPRRFPATAESERASVGLLGDLVSHEARELHRGTGLVLERGSLGVWLVGPSGALLVRPGGRRVHCYCVRVPEGDLPAGDRIAHLLLALRSDEPGFATLANCAFSGARWRVRRRLPRAMRPALDRAGAAARP